MATWRRWNGLPAILTSSQYKVEVLAIIESQRSYLWYQVLLKKETFTLHKYNVDFQMANSSTKILKWFSVSDVTSVTLEELEEALKVSTQISLKNGPANISLTQIQVGLQESYHELLHVLSNKICPCLGHLIKFHPYFSALFCEMSALFHPIVFI